MPGIDEGYVKATLDLPDGTHLEETNRITGKVEALAEEIPEVDNVITNVGFTGSQSMGGQASSDQSQIYFQLVDKGERTRSTEQIANLVRDKAESIAGAEITISATGPASEGQQSGSPVSVTIKGDDLEVLSSLAEEVSSLVETVPGTAEVSNSLGEGRPEVRVIADRDRAAAYGLGGSQIASAVRTAIQGTVATQYRTEGEEIDVRVRLEGGQEANIEDLQNLTVSSPVAGTVPIRQVARLEEAEGPNSINRTDQARVVSVTANLSGRDLGSVMEDIQTKINGMDMPQGYTIEYGGENEEMSDAFGNLGLALLLAVALVYLVMVAQFESLIYPFIIMFSVPVTIIGVTLSLLLTGRPFSVPAFIGVILLAGIVVKNAIVLVDYINVLRRRGMERDEAILKAGPTRLRPILMTALTAILAMFPMALGLGAGAEGQAPLATVVVGGLTFSTVITLVLVPVIYATMDDIPRRWKNRREKKKQKKLTKTAENLGS